MDPTFWVVLSETRATEYLKRFSCFSGQNGSSRTAWKAIVDTIFRFSRPFFDKWNWFVRYGKRDSWAKFTTVLNSEPTGFAHANGKQPWFCIMRRVKSHTMSAISLRYWENSWMKAQLSTATTPLWFGFFRCRVDVLQSQFSRRTMIGIAELWMCVYRVYRQYFDERHGVRPIPDL